MRRRTPEKRLGRRKIIKLAQAANNIVVEAAPNGSGRMLRMKKADRGKPGSYCR